MVDPYMPPETASDTAQPTSAGPSALKIVAIGSLVILALSSVGICVLLMSIHAAIGEVVRNVVESPEFQAEIRRQQYIAAFVAILKFTVGWVDTWWADMLANA